MSVTLHFQSTGTMPGDAQPFKMLGGSMTLGRADGNDLVLPDPEKMISSRHCSIEDQDGNLVVIDLSTNGTFLNYGKIALGKVPTPLNNGDILSIGPYELLVEIIVADKATLADPLPEERVSFGAATDMSDLTDPLADVGGKDDFLDGLLGGSTDGPGAVKRDQLGDDGLMPPMGEEEDFLNKPMPQDGPAQSAHNAAMSDMISTPAPATSAIPDDWDIDLELPGAAETEDEDPFAGAPEPTPVPETAPTPVTPAAAQPETILPGAMSSAPDAGTPTPALIAPASAEDSAAARAFLAALGAENLDIPDAELAQTMARLGGVMKTFVSGIRSILMTRQSIKSEFRINQTVISAGANNPLKFSVSVDQAVEAMTRPTAKGYLPAADAAREAMDDIAAHEVAMMTGMEAALKGVLAELEPSELSKRIEADKGFTSMLTNKKARYWDVFETQYEKIADQAENDFHELFSKAFADAYQAQLERLKK